MKRHGRKFFASISFYEKQLSTVCHALGFTMRQRRLQQPPPQRDSKLQKRFIYISLTIFLFFACFVLAGPLGFFTWLAETIDSLNPNQVSADIEGTPILLGLYTSESLQVTAWEIENFDEWLAEEGLNKGISIAGTYMDFEFHNPDFNVHKELGAAWDLGYTPFVNLTAYQRTMNEVVNDPGFEEKLRAWASAFARWSNRGEKRAFIAPLQEMNGGWVRYGLDPENFQLAWLKIQKVFKEEGVHEDAVNWVFAPNAWSEEGHEFEAYYPGDSVVDTVAFSAMNFGACPDYASGDMWDTFDEIYEPYLERFREMAPGKPIILAQIGSVEVGPDGVDHDRKNDWLRDTFTKLAAYPGVKGIIYLNVVKAEPTISNCRPVDWRIFDKHGSVAYDGFLEAVRNPQFAYWAPDSKEMKEITFNRREGYYEDVWPSHPLVGMVDPWEYEWVKALLDSGVAVGCWMESFPVLGTEVAFEYFCPKREVTRAEMAIFIELAMHGRGYWPPASTGMFEDVPSDHWAAGWIEQMVRDDLSSGCSETYFCPDELVSRAQMAVILGKAKYWPLEPETPAATGALFEDVRPGHWAAGWIEELAGSGVTAGCKTGKFCPEEAVSRSELAVFMVKAFNIQMREDTNWLVE